MDKVKTLCHFCLEKINEDTKCSWEWNESCLIKKLKEAFKKPVVKEDT